MKTSILVNGTSYEVDVIELNRSRATFAVNGKTFTVETEEQVPQSGSGTVTRRSTASRSRVQLQAGEAAIHAPIPGLLIELTVKEGDSVKEGAIVAKLEAMKMQNSIIAPTSGTIAKIAIGVGDEVSDGQLMMVIKSDAP